MKTTIKLTAIMLVVVMAVALLASCSKADAIKKAFENEGYEVKTLSKDDEAVKSLLKLAGKTDDDIAKMGNYEVIFASNGLLKQALIFKFNSENDIKEALAVEKDGNKDYSAFDTAKENGIINGDCWLIYGIGGANDIFKKA